MGDPRGNGGRELGDGSDERVLEEAESGAWPTPRLDCAPEDVDFSQPGWKIFMYFDDSDPAAKWEVLSKIQELEDSGAAHITYNREENKVTISPAENGHNNVNPELYNVVKQCQYLEVIAPTEARKQIIRAEITGNCLVMRGLAGEELGEGILRDTGRYVRIPLDPASVERSARVVTLQGILEASGVTINTTQTRRGILVAFQGEATAEEIERWKKFIMEGEG